MLQVFSIATAAGCWLLPAWISLCVSFIMIFFFVASFKHCDLTLLDVGVRNVLMYFVCEECEFSFIFIVNCSTERREIGVYLKQRSMCCHSSILPLDQVEWNISFPYVSEMQMWENCMNFQLFQCTNEHSHSGTVYADSSQRIRIKIPSHHKIYLRAVTIVALMLILYTKLLAINDINESATWHSINVQTNWDVNSQHICECDTFSSDTRPNGHRNSIYSKCIRFE